MTTILATWELGRALGHVGKLAPLARGLRRRGIDTAVAVRDLLTAASVTDRPFARILQAPLYQRPGPGAPTLTYAQAIADGGMADADAATILVAAWLQLFDGLRPDRVITEFAPVSLLAAHVAGLRAARIGASWSAPPATRPLPGLTPWLPDDPLARVAAGLAADTVVRTVCRRFGAPPLDGLSELLAGAPRFLASWPEFDHYGAEPGKTYYGPMTGMAAPAQPDWPPGKGPRVFIYLPGGHTAAAALAAALASLGWPALWYAPAPPPGLALNIRHSASPLDLDATLATAQLVAGRGSHATSCAALRAGCPQLILPEQQEVVLLAWRLEQQGLALIRDIRAGAPELRAALEHLVADPAIAAATRAVAARYASYDPVAAEDALARDIAVALDLG